MQLKNETEQEAKTIVFIMKESVKSFVFDTSLFLLQLLQVSVTLKVHKKDTSYN